MAESEPFLQGAFPFTDELAALLTEQRARTEAFQRKTGRIVQWVFHRRGRRVKDFRRAWETACEAAGVPGRLFHDFRRTAVRRLEQVGVARSTAMKLTGHKTETVYRRYAIVSPDYLRAAAAKLSGTVTEAARSRFTGTAGENAVRSGSGEAR